jgi:glycine betaine/proline transport system permease protein
MRPGSVVGLGPQRFSEDSGRLEMEGLMEFLTTKLPLGDGVSWLVDWMTETFTSQFRFFSDHLESLIKGMETGMLYLHPLLLIAILTLVAGGIRRSVKTGTFCLVGFLLLLNLGLWEDMVATLALILTSTFISLIIGVPVGILNARSRTLFIITRPILDFMQTIPPFVYLIPALMFFGIGEVPGVISTVVFAMPPAIRLTCLGMQQIPGELIEAGKAFGMNTWQMLFKIELPSAFPSIMMGVNQTIMMALSMVVIAALIGAGGLGAAVMRSLATVDIGLGFESGLGIVILAMLLDRIVRPE